MKENCVKKPTARDEALNNFRQAENEEIGLRRHQVEYELMVELDCVDLLGDPSDIKQRLNEQNVFFFY